MSTIPTRQIDGDVSVGRNISAGGNATVRGSVTIGHNLKVDGWLDAPNVKGPNKGLFKSGAQLREAYPNPHEGWWALVGNTLPAQVYMADGGAWVAQTEADGTPKLAGNPTVESAEYMEAVEEMTGDLEAVKGEVENNRTAIESLQTTQTTQGNQINNLQAIVEAAQAKIANIKCFNGFVTNVTYETGSTPHNSTDSGWIVVYDLGRKAFFITDVTAVNTKYYPNWLDRKTFGNDSGTLCTPTGDKIYMSQTSECYWWDGTDLVKVGGKDIVTAAGKVQGISDKVDLMETAANKSLGFLRLGVDGKILPGQIPSALRQVRFFHDIYDDLPVLQSSSMAKSTDEGCVVQYLEENGVFVLGVSSQNQTKFYNNWEDAGDFGTESENGIVPVEGKLYVDSSGMIYRWVSAESKLKPSGIQLGENEGEAFPGKDGATLKENVTALKSRSEGQGVYPFDNMAPAGSSDRHRNGIWYLSTGSGGSFKIYDDESVWEEDDYNETVTLNGEVITRARQDRLFRMGNNLYRYEGNKLLKVGTSQAGNSFNVTVEIPLPEGEYYSDIMSENITHDVLDAVYDAGYTRLGASITFAIAAGSWKKYQYVGVNETESQFKNPANWIDQAGMTAGTEPVINVDSLCPRSKKGLAGYYTLETAIEAILAEEVASGIKYAKSNLIITFRTGEYTAETYQLMGEATDFDTKELWRPFGGGGSAETSDTPEKDGKEALSTGGAYEMQQESFDHLDIDQDAENHIIKAINKKGDEMGESISIPKSSGTGALTGSSLNIYLEDPAVYAAFGSEISVRAAIKSVTFDGQGNNVTEIFGVIRRLEIIDTTSGLTLWSEAINQNSSTSPTNYTFKFDFTSFFSEASARDFTLVAHDAEGNIKRRTITVTAVDVTCTCVQTLHHTLSSTLEKGGSQKNILLYKFANNVSKQGVKVKTEMFHDGEWKQLGLATVTDSYSHSITIDPCDVFGEGETLEHGSYLIRVSGEDVASGVKGNVIYTSIMCVDSSSTEPIVSIRFNDINNGSIRLYDSLEVEFAAYTPGATATTAEVYIDGSEVTSQECQTSQTYSVRKQIQGYATDGSAEIAFHAKSGTKQTTAIKVTVSGSAISAAIKEGAIFGFDFSTRSNSDTDHSISNNGYEMLVTGSNWSSNGFGTYLGENCLRIAENVKAEIPDYKPFGTAATERTNGMALQFAFATNNVRTDDAKLMECYDANSGAGFYVCGNKVVMFCKTGQPSTITRTFKCGEKHTVGIVVEPSTITQKRGGTDYACMKLYVDGEEIGSIGYVANSGAILNSKNITFNGTEADFYLYYILAYDSYYEWAQAYQNYLCKLTDTDKMIAEFTSEDVLDNQNRPSMDKLKEKGIPYYVVVAPQATFDSFDSDINTSTKFECTLYYFHPTMPWRSFKAEHVQWRRQGTTSAKRPIKNDRFYLRKNTGWQITPIYPEYTNADALKTYELFEIGYVRVTENSIPVAIITVKVDYSDSSMANDCGVCDMMNATFRALGNDFMTPAQRAHDGTWSKSGVSVTGTQLNHSTANHPIAAFRATQDSLSDAWFHARGNWKEDKGEQVALGFQDTPGYNKGCINYGGFVEFFGKATFDAQGKFESQETLEQITARFKTTEGLDTGKLYLLSQYCGRDYKFMQYIGGEWVAATGSMKQVNGQWQITGKVLNPVTGYELITYDGMDWFMGVSSIDDMMAPVTTQSSWVSKLNLGLETYPAWTQYFECMVDDDQLQEDLARGRKVPFDLYNVLNFCDSCDYSKAALATTWGNIWKTNAWKYMSIQSLMAYYAFTDYLAAVDQQAKNMQPMFFLEDGAWVENGVYHSPSTMEPIRMYFNKVYDCDTCNGKDNDGGNTIPAELDPAEDDKCYAGRGSILWNDLRRCTNQEMVADASGNTLTLPGVVGTMRNLPELEGVGGGPFSPQGALHYFVRQRIEMWPKVVCTYDCERKYIKYSELYSDIYFYALHGSGRQSLPRFIQQRWRVRDGYYQTGDFKDASHVLGGRIGAKTGAVIKFKAAKDGYFGIGNDGGNVTQGMYLKAGEEGTFTQFQHGDNILLYIYQADLMSEIDLSQISLDPNFQFAVMALAEKIVIGSANHREAWKLSTGNTGFLENMNLGDLPFLRHIDVQTTEVTNINAERCPRLEKVYAVGSYLSRISLAETAPIDTLQLPETVTELSLVNLPNLTYPGGLTIEGMDNVNKLMLSGCPNIDPLTLINGIVESSSIQYIRLPGVNITAPSSTLTALKSSGAIGLDPTGQAYEETNKCSGVTGRWIMEDLIAETQLATFKQYFPQLDIHNSQYSMVTYSDTEEDSENITNNDNKTGYLYNTAYKASGHFKRLEEMSKGVRGTFNTSDNAMHCVRLGDDNYNFLADGTSIDLTDGSGMGYDIFKHVPSHWYKGVNDFKNQLKYSLRSICTEEPISTVHNIKRETLADILVEANAALLVSAMEEGDIPTRTLNANMNVYEIDVQGMKQVRWPGINNGDLGCVFLDAEGKIISTFRMAVSNAQFDFMAGEDYIFCDVPVGAVKFQFTSQIGCDDQEAIAVDSGSIEAIEPDWVFRKEFLVGIFGMGIDGLGRARSISGTKAVVGTGTASTSGAWTYDAAGKVTNLVAPANLNRTRQDFINLCEMRGPGYHAISYEQSKDVANIIMEIVGNRDIQVVCGRGVGSGYNTGSQTINGYDVHTPQATAVNKNINAWGNRTIVNAASGVGNLMFGIQNFVGCNYEWMSHIAMNVASFKDWKAKKCPTDEASYPIDCRMHIYDIQTDTEREVQATSQGSGYCISRVRHGRYMDTIAGKCSTDNSLWNKHYSDKWEFTASRCRVVGRAGVSANAYGGLVYAHASNVSSSSSAYGGSRLAFSGDIVFDDDAE